MTPTASPPRYDRWKAPTEDGHVLIWPSPAQVSADAIDNHARLTSADTVKLQNVPLPQVRTRLRQWLGHGEEDRPLIATGHQAELHHPGVWVKNAFIKIAAHRLGGRAIHFAVDTDEPKHLQLRWPGGSVALTDSDRLKEEWSGLVPAPTPAHLAEVANVFDAAARAWHFKPVVPPFLDSMRRSAGTSANLPAALSGAVHDLDATLGLHYDSRLVSPICFSEPYLLFVHHILARADLFAADYNASLEEYRRENKIRTPGRPMPNLKCLPEGCEAPFWLDDLSAGSRSRAAVAREDGALVLVLRNGERFRFDPAADGWSAAGALLLFLRRNGVRLAPRALTLTAVLRLLAADQFVHGIGGGQYDQVLDKLIARHFQLDPPRFSITTATLYFPGAIGQRHICIRCLAEDGHRLKHAVLGQTKSQYVNAIASAPRHSMERSALFTEMHEKLFAARKSDIYRRWSDSYDQAKNREKQEKAIFDREMFYAIQPADRLAEMIEKYRAAFAR
ncbi:MAG TPA: hypothetical protein VG326_19025 [Tepidisphaeraceae bacterium]|jgi:hypothetical protein|nr:hypothetical protein [Tepidisphaeraceae bacterium]